MAQPNGTKANQPLETPLGGVPAAPVAGRQTPEPGATTTRIGPYRIVREVGQGGMGVVYEAQQEEPVRRKVALKLIKWGMDTRAVVARFESERQALALMNHPHIASVYDAGGTAEGRPYFAMEYVQGIPITEYCDKHRLTIEERLSLFVAVCDGIQHAHQKGIIHRDIKPTNVLVTIQDGYPLPKIIDFGVAKATIGRLTEKTLNTGLGQVIGTPEYMSPEQAEMTNLDIDTRTDVYSLGVLLYELLVGALPFDLGEFHAAGLVEIQRRLREEEPVRPSTRVSTPGPDSETRASNRRVDARALRRLLHGELDWITMKALEKDRTRRYETASALALDVRRFLASEPVLAMPPSAAYRMSKFVRRHRTSLAALVAVVTIATSLAAAYTVNVARERDRSRREAAKAGAINDFLQEMLGAANPYEGAGPDVTVVDLLDGARAKLDGSFADEPDIRAAVTNTLGVTYRDLGRLEQAELLLAEALESRRQLLGEDHPDVAESLHEMGGLMLDKGDYEAAEPLFRQALAVRRGLDGNWQLEVAETQHDLGIALVNRGEFAEAERLFTESLQIVRREHGPEHRATAAGLDALASLWRIRGEDEAAEPLYREALSIYRSLLGEDHPATASCMSNLATVVKNQDRYEEAERLYRDALALQRKRLGSDHIDVAETLNDLANMLGSMGDDRAAEPIRRESLSIYRKALGEEHPHVGIATGGLARTLAKLGDDEAAEPLYRRAHEILSKSLGDDNWITANARNMYGGFLADRKRYAEAEDLLVPAYAALRSGLGHDHSRTQSAVRNLVELYEAWGKPDKVLEYRALQRVEDPSK